MPSNGSSARARVKPTALQPGDTVAIVAPGAALKRDDLERGCLGLRSLGYKPFYLESIFDHDLYFAGSVERRSRELEEMFERDEVRAIVCARGGYGCNYLLEALDLDKLVAHPKIFVGYSDVTTLLTWFSSAAGFVTFHGPMVNKDFAAENGIHSPSWLAATGGTSNWTLASSRDSGATPLAAGTAEGVLYGGCLSLLAASLGTPYEVRTDGTLLFLEDVNAKPYQIDRMLMQLRLAGKFREVRGIIFGEMLGCKHDAGYSLQDVVTRILGDLGIPVGFGLRSGHVSRHNITLPLGVNASLTVDSEVRLTILESAVALPAPAVNVAARWKH